VIGAGANPAHLYYTACNSASMQAAAAKLMNGVKL
jgi:hypothetical protein